MTAWTGRLEDPPLLTGEASYLADALTARASSAPGPPAGRAWERVRVVRSEIAHGTWRATRLSADAPAAIADAVTVLGLDAFAALPRRVPIVWHLGDQTHDHSVVADPHVRYVGQPVGLVIGPDDATLADAADWVEVTIDPLPPIAAVDAALAPDAPVLHDDRPDNVLCTFFAGADLDEVEAALASLGGDPRARHREIDLLRYQVDELDAAAVEDADEDVRLAETEEILANAVHHQESAAAVLGLLSDDDGIRDQLSAALPRLDGRGPFAEEAARVRNILADLDDLADSVRGVADSIEQDPEALAALQARRHQLQQLCRKYGDTLETVMAEHRSLADQLEVLEQADRRAEHLDAELAAAKDVVAAAAAKVRAARMAAAPELAAAIEAYLPELAMPKAKVGISIDGSDGSHVVFQLSANPGSPLQSLAKVASGGELARAMLALRSVLSEAPPILVFDEVDAGIGGQAGFAVGRALAALGDRHQVLVVTHLPQVAAFADAHLAVQKLQGDDDTVSEVHLLDDEQRRIELARMLSGQPDSSTARQHGSELLDEAQAQKGAAATSSKKRKTTRRAATSKRG